MKKKNLDLHGKSDDVGTFVNTLIVFSLGIGIYVSFLTDYMIFYITYIMRSPRAIGNEAK